MSKYLVCGYKKKDTDNFGANVKILALLDTLEEVYNFEKSLGQTKIYLKTKIGDIWTTWVYKINKKCQIPPIDIRETRLALEPISMYD